VSELAGRETLLSEVATLYYVDRFTQQQIARQIGRSVATVSRLLSEAEEKQIIEVRVRYPVPVVPELQAALVDRFGLRVARVVRASPEVSHDTLLSQIGDLAARHLATLMADGSVITVGWGTSVYEVVRSIRASPHRGIRVVQGLGSLGSRLPTIDNPLITQVLAERVNGTPHFLPAPMVVESTAIRDALARDPHFKETYNLCRHSDIALVGIGLTDPEYSGLCRGGYVDAGILERIRANGAIGDIMVEFFDLQGRIHESEIGARVMGMRQAELRKVRTVIAAAGGVVKASAILGAIRTGLIHVLVTDSATARRVIELDEETRATASSAGASVAAPGRVGTP
jgi:DNA-binding transcriptional regulator LsrR (DeoR family)